MNLLMLMSPIQCEEKRSEKRSEHAPKKRKRGYLPSVKITSPVPIAGGTFGTVYKARRTNGDEDKVVVKISSVDESDTGGFRNILNEIQALAHLQHPNTLSSNHPCYLHRERATIHVYLVLPRMQTDLRCRLNDLERWDLDAVKSCIGQISEGLSYMHSKDLVHRDIKPDNILCSYEQGKWTFKVADFGMISMLQDCHDNWVCTLWYRAPELLVDWSLNRAGPYGVGMDLWSVGCVFAEVIQKLTGLSNPLFPGKNNKDQLATIFSVRGPPSNGEKFSFNWQCQPVNDTMYSASQKRPILTPLNSILQANVDISAPEISARVRNLLHYDPEEREKAFGVQKTGSTIHLNTPTKNAEQTLEHLGSFCTLIESQLKLPE